VLLCSAAIKSNEMQRLSVEESIDSEVDTTHSDLGEGQMPTTVYFATNRVINGTSDRVQRAYLALS